VIAASTSSVHVALDHPAAFVLGTLRTASIQYHAAAEQHREYKERGKK